MTRSSGHSVYSVPSTICASHDLGKRHNYLSPPTTHSIHIFCFHEVSLALFANEIRGPRNVIRIALYVCLCMITTLITLSIVTCYVLPSLRQRVSTYLICILYVYMYIYTHRERGGMIQHTGLLTFF